MSQKSSLPQPPKRLTSADGGKPLESALRSHVNTTLCGARVGFVRWIRLNRIKAHAPSASRLTLTRGGTARVLAARWHAGPHKRVGSTTYRPGIQKTS